MNSSTKFMNEEVKTTKKKMGRESEIFASCTFSSLGLHSTLCDQLQEKMGFEVPTLVQAQAIRAILSGRHVIVNAATGTGKTIAYLVPIIHHLQKSGRRIQRADGTFALVLVPTRELCMQVYETIQKLIHRYHWIVPGYITGGESRSKEKARLRKGISILVATPGRLLDHLKNTSSFLYSNLHWIVFDEADRIFELGCGKEVEEILDHLGSRKNIYVNKEDAASNFDFPRQNLLLSATLNENINRFAKISLENPIVIGLDGGNDALEFQPFERGRFLRHDITDEAEPTGKRESFSIGDYKIPTQLVQSYVQVPCGSRLPVLFSVLKYLFEGESFEKILVLFSTCDAVDFHYSLFGDFKLSPSPESEMRLKQMFLKCKIFRLHGSMKPEDRRTTFQAFKSEKLALLLSTDIAARGLDFPKVRCIIQYDPPGEAIEYVHRVGRTARLGEKGDSLLFLQPTEIDYLQDLQNHGVCLTEYPLVKVLDSFPVHGRKQSVEKFVPLESHFWIMFLQKAVESFVVAEPEMMKLAQKAFCSWVCAYTAHRGELKRIFVVKKLHLGHVAKSFALKQQPSAVGKSFKKQVKKRKRNPKQDVSSSKKRTLQIGGYA
ncbi:DEAD-box ATP-dependent RNA helicase 17 [Momordica charantia]|uniref:ATP-dependent RNA helicase n=1 Tax=Momordica charantia TaxID=3673 RepID=A0A6J1DL75_MOMCH|nr:DEAD-box ATP-dependent RNA helicase 17 [Momordica charantia]